jgi:F-type H+-transporting ATPase subunit delta
LLRVLNDHERLDLLRPIYWSIRELSDERAHRVRVRVDTAAPLQDEQRSRLKKEIEEALHLTAVLDEKIDPDLLGGMRVRVNDWQFDASVATRLESLRKDILQRGAHEIQTGRDRFSAAS